MDKCQLDFKGIDDMRASDIGTELAESFDLEYGELFSDEWRSQYQFPEAINPMEMGPEKYMKLAARRIDANPCYLKYWS